MDKIWIDIVVSLLSAAAATVLFNEMSARSLRYETSRIRRDEWIREFLVTFGVTFLLGWLLVPGHVTAMLYWVPFFVISMLVGAAFTLLVRPRAVAARGQGDPYPGKGMEDAGTRAALVSVSAYLWVLALGVVAALLVTYMRPAAT